MTTDPQVDLAFSLSIPRYEATGVDPNDLRALMARSTRWEDWCRLWSEEGARHERLGQEAAAKGFRLTAAEAYVRAAIYYHYGKNLYADHPDEFRAAHEAMLRCYTMAAPDLDPPIERRGISVSGRGNAWLASQARRHQAATRRHHSPCSVPRAGSLEPHARAGAGAQTSSLR
jgi:2,6-dihydroxypseudooxynicotine hydrolase